MILNIIRRKDYVLLLLGTELFWHKVCNGEVLDRGPCKSFHDLIRKTRTLFQIMHLLPQISNLHLASRQKQHEIRLLHDYTFLLFLCQEPCQLIVTIKPNQQPSRLLCLFSFLCSLILKSRYFLLNASVTINELKKSFAGWKDQLWWVCCHDEERKSWVGHKQKKKVN